MPVDLLTLGAAFISGLIGSVHCLVMCGGVATGLAAASRAPGDAPLTGRAAFDAALALNIGRVIGYSIGGLLVGLWLGFVIPPRGAATLQSFWQRPVGQTDARPSRRPALVAAGGVLVLGIVLVVALQITPFWA